VLSNCKAAPDLWPAAAVHGRGVAP